LGKWIPTLPDEPVDLAKINIIYRRDPDALETMILSDGANEVTLYPSPLGRMSMLLGVIGAIVQLIPYQGEHTYLWEGEQVYYCWHFQLDGDTLRIHIDDWWGEAVFSTTCLLWQFAAKLRLCASRLAVAEDARRPHGGDCVRNDIGYQQLSYLLDGRKSN
jgi:hypothetical protein